MLVEACFFIHKCVDEKKYKEGFEIGRQLFSMEILCLNEYGDEEFKIGDMVYHELLHWNMEQVILDTLYCAYQATVLQNRTEALYEVIVNADDNQISLESIMQHGEEALPDFQNFLTNWITFLGDKAGRDADRLFLEAVSMLNNVSAACNYAEKFVVNHPGLYLYILENVKSVELGTMVSIGMQAMKRIPKKYVMRSKAALKTADYINRSKEQQDLLDKCYFAAYESDTSPLNYIRALLHGYGTEKKRV